MKPTAEQKAEAAKRGIVPGAVIGCYTDHRDTATVPDYEEWTVWLDGCTGFKWPGVTMNRIYICDKTSSHWATVITPAPSAMEARIAAAEASLQRLNTAIAELRAIIEKPVEAPQGLQEGDYCDASKEVADALTAMGWGWYTPGFGKRSNCKYISQGSVSPECMKDHSDRLDTHLNAHTFLARARVTAAELGLKAPEPWQPKAGDWVVVVDIWKTDDAKVGDVLRIDEIDSQGDAVFHNIKGEGYGLYLTPWKRLRPATAEEIKAATTWKPKFGDRVITPNGEGIYWYVHRNGVHTVIFAEGDRRYYNTSQLSTIKP